MHRIIWSILFEMIQMIHMSFLDISYASDENNLSESKLIGEIVNLHTLVMQKSLFLMIFKIFGVQLFYGSYILHVRCLTDLQ